MDDTEAIAPNVKDTVVIIAGLALAMLVPQVVAHWTPWGSGGSAGPHPSQIFAAVLIAGLSLSYGRALARVFRLSSSDGITTAFEVVAGFAGVSLVHLLATTIFGLSAVGALPIDVVVAGVLVAASARVPAERRDVQQQRARSRFSPATLDAMLLVVVAGIAGFWAREAITALKEAEVTGVFRAWQDFFLHSAEITYLRDYPVFHRGSLYLAGSPQPFYHRASYAMPALYSAISGSRSVETATTFWMPLGLTLCGFAAYGFGAAVAGRTAGVTAVGALFLLPDASMYGVRNGFFSFHWLLQIAPGSGFAIAITLIALGFFISGGSGGVPELLLGSVLLAASALAFRIHVAILGTALVATLALMAWRPTPRWTKWAALFAMASVAGVALFGLEQVKLAPHFFTARSHPLMFFDVAHGQGPDRGALFARLADGGGAAWRVFVGYSLMLAACVGLLLPAAMGTSLMRWPWSPGWRVAAIPFLLPTAYLGMILIMPTPAHGDFTDYSHRPFVLVYAVLAAITGAEIGRRLTLRPARPGRTAPGRAIPLVAAAMVAACGCAVPWIYGRDIQQRWGPHYASISMTADVFKASDYVRSHSTPGEEILASREDPFAMFVALSERPAFVSRMELFRILGGEVGSLAASRSAQHSRLGGLASFEQLREFGRENRISWYFLDRLDMPAWPQTLRDRCSYCGPDIRVFDLR